MPTYEYACTKCGQHVEVFQRVSDEPLTECGVCGGQLRKVFHPAGILFKGSGFYSTDSRTKPSGDGTSKKPAEKSSEKKSDSTGSGTSTGGKDGSSSSSSSSSSSGSAKERSA